MSGSVARLLRDTLVLAANALPLSVRRSIHDWPLVGSWQRKLFRAVVRDTPVAAYTITAGPARGLRLALKLPENKAFWLGTFELPAAQLVSQTVRAGEVCWDVGAHLGYFAAIMARCSAQPVYCFEPLPENQQRLQMQAELNPALQLHVLPLALGAAAGATRLRVMPDDDSLGKLAESTFQPDRPAARELPVTVTTIDAVVADNVAPPPSFIKIDTEGAEFQVLSGGQATLRRHRPRLLLEFHDCSDDPKLLELLGALEYRCRVVESGQALDDAPLQRGQHLYCVPA